MDSLLSNVNNAINQYEQASSNVENYYSMATDAENEAYRYYQQAMSAEDPNERNNAMNRMNDAKARMLTYQRQYEQAQQVQEQARRYLEATRAELPNAINALEGKIANYEQSLSVFSQMSSMQFGGNAAAGQIATLQAKKQEHQNNLNMAYSMLERINAVLDGSGTQPYKVKTR